MKSFIALVLFSTMTWSASSQAFSFFGCEAQMVGRTQYSPKGVTAPYLVHFSKSSIKDARHQEDLLSLIFNAEVIKADRAYVILDGRGQNIHLNVHISATATERGVLLALRDTESGKTLTREVTLENSGKTIVFTTDKGFLDYTCIID